MLLCFVEGVSRVPTSGSVAGFVAAYGPYWGYLTGVLNWAAAVVASGGIAAAAADIIGCAAALRLRRRGTALAGLPVRIPALQMFAVLGSAAMLWVAAQSTRAEALGIAGLIVAVSVAYRLRRQPALASA